MRDKGEIIPSFLGQQLAGDVARVLKEPSHCMTSISYVLLAYDLGCKVLYARKPGRSHEGCKTCKDIMVSMLSINITIT